MSLSVEHAEQRNLSRDETLEEKARSLIRPILRATGPIQYADLVNGISTLLGYSEETIVPHPIKLAVLEAWHEREFSMASDRTISLNEKHHNSGKKRS